MYNKFIITYLEERRNELKEAECPEHLECGGQDGWYEATEYELKEVLLALNYVKNDKRFSDVNSSDEMESITEMLNEFKSNIDQHIDILLHEEGF